MDRPSQPLAISRLDAGAIGHRAAELRRAVFDAALRAQLIGDNGLFSMVLRSLLRADAPVSVDQAGRIPRVIMQYWHDRENLPGDVAACMASWRGLERSGAGNWRQA